MTDRTKRLCLIAAGAVAIACAIVLCTGCSIEGAPVPGPASRPSCAPVEPRPWNMTAWALAESRAFAQRHEMRGRVTFQFRDENGVDESGVFLKPALIVIYLRGPDGRNLCPCQIRRVVRHELLHWLDHHEGRSYPEDHDAIFKQRIAKEWPE